VEKVNVRLYYWDDCYYVYLTTSYYWVIQWEVICVSGKFSGRAKGTRMYLITLNLPPPPDKGRFYGVLNFCPFCFHSVVFRRVWWQPESSTGEYQGKTNECTALLRRKAWVGSACVRWTTAHADLLTTTYLKERKGKFWKELLKECLIWFLLPTVYIGEVIGLKPCSGDVRRIVFSLAFLFLLSCVLAFLLSLCEWDLAPYPNGHGNGFWQFVQWMLTPGHFNLVQERASELFSWSN
jgi:hypothetical protein